VIDSANLLDYCEQSFKYLLPVVHDAYSCGRGPSLRVSLLIDRHCR